MMKVYVALVLALHILSVQSGPWGDSREDSDDEGSSEEKGIWDKFKECVGEIKECFSESVGEVKEFVDSALELGDNVVDNAIDLFNYKEPSPEPTYDVGTSNNANGFGDNPDFIPLQPSSPPVIDSHTPNKIPAQRPVPPPRKSPQTPTKNSSPRPPPPGSSQIPPENSTSNPSTQPHDPSQMTPQTPTENSSAQPQPSIPPQITPKNSTLNPSPQPQPLDPSQMTPQTPTENPSLQPQPSIPPLIPASSDTNCTCTPFFRCYDEETSSNLTGVVDDRIRNSTIPESCPDPNEVCCHNLVQPLSPPTNNQSSSQPQPHGPSLVSSDNSTQSPLPGPEPSGTPLTFSEDSTQSPSLEPQPTFPPHISTSDANCTCTPFFICYDGETSSNLATDIQESCLDPNEVCCHNLVQPLSPPTNNQSSSQPQPHGPSLVSPDNSTQSPLPGPEPSGTPLTFLEDSTQSPSLEPQPTFPPHISTSDANCTCTPFFRCYDEETSSNLTSVVDDRIPATDIDVSCPEPNDVCCYNHVQPLAIPSINQSSQSQPQDLSQTYPQNSTLNPSSYPQSQSPSQISPNKDCTCTLFAKCHDKEKYSNATDLDVGGQKICLDSDEICCYHLHEPLFSQSTDSSIRLEPKTSTEIFQKPQL